MPADALVTVGIPTPAGFPREPYEAVHALVAPSPISTAKRQYNGGWNAVPFRFREVVEADEAFRELIRCRPSRNWVSEEEYQLSKNLLSFFASGTAVFESCFYAMYAIGTMAKLPGFDVSTPKARKAIDIGRDNQRKLFPVGGLWSTNLERVIQSPNFKQWGIFRNILSHRQVPLLTKEQWIGDKIPRVGEVRWEDNEACETLDFTEAVTTERLAWLRSELKELLEAALDFVNSVKRQLPKPV